MRPPADWPGCERASPVNICAFACSSAHRTAAGCADVRAAGRTLSVPRPRTARRPGESGPALLRKEDPGRSPPHARRRPSESATPSDTETWPTPGSSGSRHNSPSFLPSNTDAAAIAVGQPAVAQCQVGRSRPCPTTSRSGMPSLSGRPPGGRTAGSKAHMAEFDEWRIVAYL